MLLSLKENSNKGKGKKQFCGYNRAPGLALWLLPIVVPLTSLEEIGQDWSAWKCGAEVLQG